MTVLQLLRTPNGLEGIRLPLNSYKIFVPLRDIMRLEGQRNYTLFVLKTGQQILVSKTLGIYEELLPSEFIRVNRGCIINTSYLDFAPKGNFRLKDGYEIPVSRRKVKYLEALLQAA
ncbi:LytR/AlgR family response regulator transcription factor [Runella sp.]|uniref:LytR/AlgR family response regulator transcription factor n=1 Tax=Runella sp. TaxID=1960881 RepID=UPI003D0E37CF